MRRPLDGVLLLDKPIGVSSNNILQRVKWLYRAERAGHTGTLDPLATGLLPLAFGEATKFSQGLLDADKRYRATIRFGATTSTADAEGEVLERRAVTFDEAALLAALERFTGAIEQVPPMYSALKRDGKPLYAYARAGIELERQPRAVTIHALRLVSYRAPDAVVDVDCSKGTYVRTLAEDIGRVLGAGAHLAALRRTGVGALDVSNALAVATIEQASESERDALLAPIDALVAAYPRADVDADAARAFGHGQTVHPIAPPRPAPAVEISLVRIYGPADQFLGVGTLGVDGRLAPSRVAALR